MDLEKKLQGFQLIGQEKLQAVICSIPGKKDLILEQSLIKPLEHICAASWLKLKGIQKIYKFNESTPIPGRLTSDQVQVFMIRSTICSFQYVLKHILKDENDRRINAIDTHNSAAIKNFHIICVPNCFTYFHSILEEEGLYGIVELHRYSWDFIYMDQGLLSLEIINLFPSIYFEEDTSLLPSIAHSLRILQMVTGRPELILTFGSHSSNIMKMIHALGTWPKINNPAEERDFSAMILLDRDKDYASTLLTPAIYAGLLLEVFNNRTGELEIDLTESNKIQRQKLKVFLVPDETKKGRTIEAKSEKQQKPIIIRLNGIQDEIYGDNRYKSFTQASSLVREQAKAIGLEAQKLNDMKLDEMQEYVARKLPKITELKMKVMHHLNASEKIIEMLGKNFQKVQSLEEDILNNVSRKKILNEIDDLLTVDGQQYNTLRLLCLFHHCVGITSEELSTFVKNYCNYFGRKHLPVFHKLAKANLLPHLLENEKQNKSAKLLSNLPIPKFQQTEFQANANRLKLLIGSVADSSSPSSSSSTNRNDIANNCPSYVFNGLYIPLVAQLCTFLMKSNNGEEFTTKLNMIDHLQLYVCNTNEYLQCNPKSYGHSIKQLDIKDVFPMSKRNILVYIVGGVTYAEIGACDLVSKLTGSTIIITSDSIISGGDLICGAFQ